MRPTNSWFVLQSLIPQLFLTMMIWGILNSFDCEVRAEIRPEFEMDVTPETALQTTVTQYPRRLTELWLEALSRAEDDYQHKAAETIARAHPMGVPGLEAAIPRLLELVSGKKTHRATRFAAARALIVLNAKDSAKSLWDAASRNEFDLRQLVEPALANWHYKPAVEVWRQRLVDEKARPREVLLAIRALATMSDQDSCHSLRQLVLDSEVAPDIRLEAASALGTISQTDSSEIEKDVRTLMKRSRGRMPLDRLCAVRLLARQSNTVSQQLLMDLAGDPEPAIGGKALNRLNEIDPELVVPIAETAMKNDDSLVRRCGAVAYVARPTVDRIAPLASLLDDPHPEVRGYVRESLYLLDQKSELKAKIREEASRVMGLESWRGQEQAALLLAALNHKPASSRMVELLESNRPEVMVASAWGLKKLAIPATFPAILDKATRQTDMRSTRVPPGLDDQTAHLLETLGRGKFKPVEPLLKRHFPKMLPGAEMSRSAAMWCYGWLYEGNPDKAIGAALIGRITDPGTMPPELDRVRAMSAVSLVRMNATEHTDALKVYLKTVSFESPFYSLLTSGWKELSGEEFPIPPPRIIAPGVWFLEPIETQSPPESTKSQPR